MKLNCASTMSILEDWVNCNSLLYSGNPSGNVRKIVLFFSSLKTGRTRDIVTIGSSHVSSALYGMSAIIQAQANAALFPPVPSPRLLATRIWATPCANCHKMLHTPAHPRCNDGPLLIFSPDALGGGGGGLPSKLYGGFQSLLCGWP